MKDFAELLTVLYALYVIIMRVLTRYGLIGCLRYRPAELVQYTSPNADIAELLSVVEMTNKYHFATTSTWAITTLCEVTNCRGPWRADDSEFHPPSWCKSHTLRRIIDVAILCGHEPLRDHAVEMWIKLLRCNYDLPDLAMEVADRYGLARLKGASYYQALLSSRDDLSCGYIMVDDILTGCVPTSSQRAHLLSGFFSLVRRWEKIRTSPPTFARSEGCTFHAHGCLSTWSTTWKTAMKSDDVAIRGPADILGRLRAAQQLLAVDLNLRDALTPACRRAAVQSVKDLYETEEDNLASHFRDLTSETRNVGGDTGPD